MSIRLGIIVLAGGQSARFGDNKLLSAHPAGSALLEYVLTQYSSLAHQCAVVVTGCYHSQLTEHITAPAIPWLHNAHWQHGMATSIVTGVREIMAVSSQSSLSHILIGVGDTPMVTTASLKRLVNAANDFPDHRIASEVAGKAMSPAIFPVSDVAALLQLKGDKGAASLLREPGYPVINVGHEEVALDIDRPSDWQNFRR